METLNLTKGNKCDLTKTNPGLKVAGIGLGWDVNQGNGNAFDLDAFALVLKGGKVTSPSDILYFNNKSTNGLIHSGDNLTGAGDGDDETIKANLNAIPAEVDQVLVGVNIYQADTRRQNFGMVNNAFIRVYDSETSQEILKYDLSEDYSSGTGVIVGKLYRHDGEWKFQAMGSSFQGSINDAATPYN